MANLSKLHVEVTASTGSFARSMDKNEKRVKTFRGRVAGAGTALTGMATAAAGAVVAMGGLAVIGKKAFDLGATMEETGSKFRTVFGPEASAEVQGFLDGFANKAGLTNTEAQGLVATTGAIAQGMGFAQNESGKFATQITKVAADLSSFNNMPTEEVLMAVNSALTGEREQMKRLGIVIKETDVQQLALANSGKEVAAALTQQEKATATLELITSKAGVAIGDLDRTQGSAANVAKRLGAMFRELKETLATALMPAFKDVLTDLDGASSGFADMKEKILSNTATISAWARVAVKAFAFVATAIAAPIRMVGNLIQAFGNFLQSWKAFFQQDAEAQAEAEAHFQKNIKEGIESLIDPFKAGAGLARELGKAIMQAGLDGKRLNEEFGNAAQVINSTTDPAVKGLVDTIETLDEKLRDMTQEFTKNFVDRMVKSVNEAENAFAGFFNYMRQEIVKLIVRWAAFQALTKMFPHSEFIAGITGTPATAQAGMAPNAADNFIKNPGAITLNPQVMGGGGRGGMTVNQNISFSVQAIDGQDASRFLTDNKQTIAKVISEATRDSTGFRHQLLSGAT
jgi:hypothetical protein